MNAPPLVVQSLSPPMKRADVEAMLAAPYEEPKAVLKKSQLSRCRRLERLGLLESIDFGRVHWFRVTALGADVLLAWHHAGWVPRRAP